MMGHTISTYNDIKMKGIEFLRNLYAQTGLSIKPKTRTSKIEQLKLIIEAWGMNPEEILTRKALASPHRTLVDPKETEIKVIEQSPETGHNTGVAPKTNRYIRVWVMVARERLELSSAGPEPAMLAATPPGFLRKCCRFPNKFLTSV